MRQNLDSPFHETPGRTARHLAASLAAPGLAAASLANSGLAEPLPSASIARMAQLPSGGLQAVETTDGELLFFSENGRYVLRGSAVDLWHGAKLTAFDQTQRLAGRIDLVRLKLDVADLGAIDVGDG